MKRRVLILIVIILSILVSTACRSLDTDDVKVIEKPKTEDSVGQNQDNTSNQNNNNDSKNNNGKNNTGENSDLNEKGEVLQADTEEYIKKIINDKANEVLKAIRDYDLEKLSKAVHPDKGVRFTPYAYVSNEDLLFSAEEIRKIGKNNTEYVWGSYDGSGEPIKLTFEDYYKSFIYDEDFINAKEIGYNKRLGQGNSLDNSSEFYKNSIVVEYHFPEIDPQYEGMDWRSLRLVFEKMNNTWYLVGIIHDQWTI